MKDNRKWLYELVQRVPEISDEQIADMRHIEPVLRVGDSCMYRRVLGASRLDPRNVSCLWDAEPTGDEFTFGAADNTTIVTQHRSSVFFKPSLAEVYAWLRVFFPDCWGAVQYFCLGEATRVSASSDVVCQCVVMGGTALVCGDEFTTASGEVGHTLIPEESA